MPDRKDDFADREQMFTRTEVKVLSVPPLHKVENRVQFLFSDKAGEIRHAV
jgi:hypothetical protein